MMDRKAGEIQGAAELLAEVYACACRGDWEGVAARVTDDFMLCEADSTPFGGAYRGKDAMQRCAAAVFGT
jgi:hypothetical protein